MPNKSIKELEDESEKYFKSAKRWENVAKGAKVADTVLGVGAAVGGPTALLGKAALRKGMNAGVKKMMGGVASKGSDRLKKSIVSKSKSKAPWRSDAKGKTIYSEATKLRRMEQPDSPFRKSTAKESEWFRTKTPTPKNKLKAPAPKDAAAKYVKEFKTRDFKKDIRTKKPSIYPKAAAPVAAGTAAGFVAGNRTAKKNNTGKAKTTKPKGKLAPPAQRNTDDPSVKRGALPGVGTAMGAANAARKAKQKAPRAIPIQGPSIPKKAPKALPVKPPMEVIPRATQVESKTPRYKKEATLPWPWGGNIPKRRYSEEEAVNRPTKKK
jgi:hypothetical protein